MADERNINESLRQLIDQSGQWFTKYQTMIIDYAIHFIIAVIILAIGIMVANFINKTLVRVMKQRKLDPMVSQFFSSIIKYAILAFVAVAALSQLGIQTTSFVAIIGAAGLAVGLALQSSLSNFASGVLLIIFRPFQVNDYVELGGAEGKVKDLQIFSTTLVTSDGKIVIIPNSKIVANNLINYSTEPNRRLQLSINVAITSDIETVKKVLTDTINNNSNVIKELGVSVRLNNMTGSAMEFVILAWATNGNFGTLKYDLLESIKQALDSNGIKTA